ncbi:MAG: AraC family transcriptional regulator [Oscillospiraceae bacterium]|nr:AraC family transcriptional regulator [Oscillospiraceae bacterium]
MGIYSIVFDRDPKDFSRQGGADARDALYSCVEMGDLARFEQVFGDFDDTLMSLIKDDRTHYKFTIQYVMAQLELIAVRGGLSLMECNELEDRYYRRLETTASPAEAVALLKDHCRALTEMIAECRELSPITRECRAYVQSHLYDDLSLPAIAAALQYSESYLSHRFREDLGQSVNDYVRQMRIARAKTLLRQDCSVAQIANMLCFSSQSHFAVAFKKATGLTPSAYRKSLPDGS